MPEIAINFKTTLPGDTPVSSSDPLPVTNTAGNASLDDIETAVEIMDDWDESDRAKVNPIVGQAGVAAGAGAVDALTQRVTIATDGNVVNTELAAAVALANDMATPTTPPVISHLTVFDQADNNHNPVYAPAAAGGAIDHGNALPTVVHLATAGGNVSPIPTSQGDGRATTEFMPTLITRYNGATSDRVRNNVEANLLASAARTATTNTADQTAYDAKGVIIHVDATVVAATETITPVLQFKQLTGGGYVSIASFTAIATAGDYVYIIQPGVAETIAAAAVESQAVPLSRTWRMAFTHSSTGSHTYSVDKSEIAG